MRGSIMRKHTVCGLAGGAALLLLAGCCCLGGRSEEKQAPARAGAGASVYVAPVPSSVERIAVMPFKAPTELIGLSMSDLFVTELMRMGRYQLVERTQLAGVLSEAEIALSGLSDARAVELGHMVGADGVVIGTVDEFDTIARSGQTYASVGISVRLIDCESSRVLWTATLAERADDPGVPLSQHARAVVRNMVFSLQKEWRVQRQVRRNR